MTPDLTKKRIQELVPEVMELKFGCEVILKPTRRGLLYSNKFPSKKFWRNDARLRWDNKNGWIDGTEMSSLILNEDVEILGSPITLAVVLRAIREGVADEYSQHEAVSGIIWGDKLHNQVGWNLAKDFYDDQSEETKKFIGKLIGAI